MDATRRGTTPPSTTMETTMINQFPILDCNKCATARKHTFANMYAQPSNVQMRLLCCIFEINIGCRCAQARLSHKIQKIYPGWQTKAFLRIHAQSVHCKLKPISADSKSFQHHIKLKCGVKFVDHKHGLEGAHWCLEFLTITVCQVQGVLDGKIPIVCVGVSFC